MGTVDDSNLDSMTRNRKFGLPNWMMNNIERLNFVTDFEQYACSPPETESFLTEHVESCDFHDNSPPEGILNESVKEKPKFTAESKRVTESKSAPNLLANATEKLATLSVVENLKHEEFYSSPDTTPCPTPEPSPAPRRKMSGQQDTVQTNPGRWFYLGNFKKHDQNVLKGQGLNINSNKENRKKSLDKSNEMPLKFKDPSVKAKKDGIKLVISNFDINAISPSSW